MRLVLAAAILLAVPAGAQTRIEPLPVTFLPGGASTEGCRRQWQTSASVTAHSAPSEFSRPLRTIDAMRRVDANDYSESLTAVLQPGRARALQSLTIDAVRLDRNQRTEIPVGAGNELVVLGTGVDETVYFTIAGVVYAGTLPGYTRGTGVEITERPVAEVWVRLVSHDAARPEAWLNTAQAGMVERERACGG